MTVAKSTKGGLGRGLDALLGSYEETIAPATRPAPAARPAQVPAPNAQRIEEEEEFEREEINETYPRTTSTSRVSCSAVPQLSLSRRPRT